MKILFIRDELKEFIQTTSYLQDIGYYMKETQSSEEGLEFAMVDTFDLVLIDLISPTINGIHLLSDIRKRKLKVPIIMLSSVYDRKSVVNCLNLGADDFLATPLDLDELAARINALHRRVSNMEVSHTYQLLDVVFNPSLLLLSKGEKQVFLPLKEAQMLEILIKHKKRPVPTDTFIARIWSHDYNVSDECLRQHLCKLRKKLKSLNENIDINVKRKVGYKLEF